MYWFGGVGVLCGMCLVAATAGPSGATGSPPVPAPTVDVVVCNSTPYLVVASMDGPSMRSADLAPYGVCTQWKPVLPGAYEFQFDNLLKSPGADTYVLQFSREGEYHYPVRNREGVVKSNLAPGSPLRVRLVAEDTL